MTKPTMVTNVNDLTPEWVTSALVHSGDDVEVESVEISPVGTGQMASSYRLDLTYARGDGPASLVAKIASDDDTSRAAGASGGYSAEVDFYLEVAETVEITVPSCHYGAMGDDGYFVLLLEDLAPAQQGDQIKGCTPEQAEAAVVNLAGLHGPRWCDETVHGIGTGAGAPDAESSAFVGELLRGSTAAFIDRYDGRLAPDHKRVLRHFADNVEQWILARPACFGLVHGDYRLDNLMFATEAGGYPCAAVDWQTLGSGLPARDLGYCIGTSLPSSDRLEHERHLVTRYHDALTRFDVGEYDLDTCWSDYCLGLFQGPYITVLGAMHVIRTDRGDDMFMAMAERSCDAICDLDAADLLG